jgi:hypothetical protein
MKMKIAVDFDGTIVTNKYPSIGTELPFATETLKLLAREGHQLILWTCREGELLNEALKWCSQRGLEFYAVNADLPGENSLNNPNYTRKLKADLFIDDRNVGGLPDWGTIRHIIHSRKSLEQIVLEEAGHPAKKKKKKGWWPF